jgi:hypothetical protein
MRCIGARRRGKGIEGWYGRQYGGTPQEALAVAVEMGIWIGWVAKISAEEGTLAVPHNEYKTTPFALVLLTPLIQRRQTNAMLP